MLSVDICSSIFAVLAIIIFYRERTGKAVFWLRTMRPSRVAEHFFSISFWVKRKMSWHGHRFSFEFEMWANKVEVNDEEQEEHEKNKIATKNVSMMHLIFPIIHREDR